LENVYGSAKNNGIYEMSFQDNTVPLMMHL